MGKEEEKVNYIKVGFWLIVVLFMFFLILRGMISYQKDTVWRNEGFCKLKYGTKERGYEQFFGDFCAEVNYENHTIIKHYYTFEEMMDYCGRIKFWELNKWRDRCSP